MRPDRLAQLMGAETAALILTLAEEAQILLAADESPPPVPTVWLEAALIVTDREADALDILYSQGTRH